ncbi:hypothetical protein NE237_018011 [Protea cynaroides]|uniref:Zinc finger Mcm10/DnaG-type domain-containing protein n=1 Tax=Protea cynaroides TaxID=273540 RepID=A0A9Q0QNK7_9MAGN|nr:hypothetical protein NE237_018011 [Protea cynaroides]
MSTHQDDLDLLLSLQDRVLETPPGSPSTLQSVESGYLSEDGSPKRVRKADMSVFRDSVGEYLKNETNIAEKASRLSKPKNSNDIDVEKFSGLRIRKPLVSAAELSNHFSDIRFVLLPAIRNLLVGDKLSGCWATVGVLAEKGERRVSSTGKSFCIWRIGCLDENTTPVFLFGDAYTKNCNEMAGTVFAFFNAGVRKDPKGSGFSLSVFSANQILKMGTSVDYGVCKGKRKDGIACTAIINKRNGMYCKYHKSKTSQKYSVIRSELNGGNLRTAFRDPLKSEGIYLVDPLDNKTNLKKSMQPVKLLSVERLKEALSNAGKVTTNTHSQGLRFLAEVTGKMHPKNSSNLSAVSNHLKGCAVKRLSSSPKLAPTMLVKNQQPDIKRKKTNQASEKMIELDIIDSWRGGFGQRTLPPHCSSAPRCIVERRRSQ